MRWYGWTVWPRAAWDVVWSFEAYHGVPHFLKSSRWNMITFGHVIALGVHLRFLTQKMEAMARWSRWFTSWTWENREVLQRKLLDYQRVYAVIGGSSCYSLQVDNHRDLRGHFKAWKQESWTIYEHQGWTKQVARGAWQGGAFIRWCKLNGFPVGLWKVCSLLRLLIDFWVTTNNLWDGQIRTHGSIVFGSFPAIWQWEGGVTGVAQFLIMDPQFMDNSSMISSCMFAYFCICFCYPLFRKFRSR